MTKVSLFNWKLWGIVFLWNDSKSAVLSCSRRLLVNSRDVPLNPWLVSMATFSHLVVLQASSRRIESWFLSSKINFFIQTSIAFPISVGWKFFSASLRALWLHLMALHLVEWKDWRNSEASREIAASRKHRCTPPTLTHASDGILEIHSWSNNSFDVETLSPAGRSGKARKASFCILKFVCNSLFFLNRRKETRRCYQESRNPCILVASKFS